MNHSMENLNCEYFQITVYFDEKSFKTTKFKKAADCNDDAHNAFVSHYINATDHAHIEIVLQGEDSKMEVSLHSGGLENELETSEKEFEDCLTDLSQFFKRKKLVGDVRAAFRYDDSYESVLKLNYPVLISDNLFQDAVIAGHTIEFGEDSLFDRANISSRGNSTFLFVGAIMELNLGGFNPYSAIKEMSQPSQSLIRRK